jgi:hypothetical protein
MVIVAHREHGAQQGLVLGTEARPVWSLFGIGRRSCELRFGLGKRGVESREVGDLGADERFELRRDPLRLALDLGKGAQLAIERPQLGRLVDQAAQGGVFVPIIPRNLCLRHGLGQRSPHPLAADEQENHRRQRREGRGGVHDDLQEIHFS